MRQRRSRLRPRRPHHLRPRPLLAAAFGLLALAGCGGDQRVTETADSAVAYGAAPFDSGRVDSSAGTLDSTAADSSQEPGESPEPASPEFVLVADSVAGREIYNGAGTCFTCHALDGAGVTPLGSSLRDSVWTHIDGSLAAIARVIRDGLPAASATLRGMPAFGSRLSEEELYRLAAYTYTLSHPGSAVADTAVVDSVWTSPVDTSIAPR